MRIGGRVSGTFVWDLMWNRGIENPYVTTNPNQFPSSATTLPQLALLHVLLLPTLYKLHLPALSNTTGQPDNATHLLHRYLITSLQTYQHLLPKTYVKVEVYVLFLDHGVVWTMQLINTIDINTRY
jgi:hypothetical protein